MLAIASQDAELLEYAKSKGASGINVAGICCTANEVLMRHGLPIVGNFLQQELAILTGAVEVMVIDVQCVMPSLAQVTKCFHTKLISTSEIAHTSDAEAIEFNARDGYEQASDLIRKAIDNFEYRDQERVHIPNESMELVAGFSNETIFHMLGGRFRSTFRPLNDAIIDGRIRGVVGIVGCSNPKVVADHSHVKLAEELIKRNVLVLQTGCAAIACAKAGLLTPEAALAKAGADPARSLRSGRHSAGTAHGLVRRQQPHSAGGHQRPARRRTGRRPLRPAGGGRSAGMDEREGGGHRPLLRGQRPVCRARPSAVCRGQQEGA